jgi:hypothetical protein
MAGRLNEPFDLDPEWLGGRRRNDLFLVVRHSNDLAFFLDLLSEERDVDPEAITWGLSRSARDDDLGRRPPRASRARNRVVWFALLFASPGPTLLVDQ